MIKKIFLYTIIVFSLLTLYMMIFQRHFIYFPNKQKPNPRDFNAEDMKVVTIKTRDGLYLNSWFKPPRQHKPTILFLHGNAGHIGYRMPFARYYSQAGFGILLLEYRGYGGNKGYPNENGLYEDARAAMQFLQDNKIENHKIILYGESLGSAIAIQLALEYPVCALVLQSPFTSMSALARYHYPWIFLAPWDKFSSDKKINKIKVPLLIIHAKQDRVVPYSQSLTLYSQAADPKKLYSIQNGDHNEIWNPELYEQILQFINKYCSL